MIFRRALLREVTQTAATVFIALFAILLTTQLIRLLNEAAGGKLASQAVMELAAENAANEVQSREYVKAAADYAGRAWVAADAVKLPVVSLELQAQEMLQSLIQAQEVGVALTGRMQLVAEVVPESMLSSM